MSWASAVSSWFVSRPIEQDIARLWRLVCRHAELLLLAVGVLVRVQVYLRNPKFVFDEGLLWGNIDNKPMLDFSHPMLGDQLAPLGFLMALRGVVQALGPARLAARLIPFLSGIAALFLFRRLAPLVLPRAAAVLALALFVCSEDLIYYACQMKPYSLDVAIGLGLTLAAVEALGKPVSPRRAAWTALLVIAACWFSFSSVFITAGGGSVLIVDRIRARDRKGAALWAAIGIFWLGSFAAAHQVSQELLSPATTMYRFWDFAFLPVFPLPMSVVRAYIASGILLEVFVNPLNMVAPLWLGVVLPIFFLGLGSLFLARRSWAACAILVVPIILAIAASALKRYPFHGRLILELVPAFHLLFAAGAALLLSQTAGLYRLAGHGVVLLVLAQPCLAGLYLLFDEPPRNHNSHGDLHKNLFLVEDVGPPAFNPTAPLPGQRGMLQADSP